MSRKNRQSDAARYRLHCYNFWLNRMIKIAVSSICWQGLPDTMDAVELEKTLNFNGSAIIVRDDIIGRYFNGANASAGPLDIYGYPTERRVVFKNGKSLAYDKNDAIIVYNNSLRGPDWLTFEAMAGRLADLDVVIRVNTNLQKTVPIIPTTDYQRLSLDNVMQQIDSGALFVPVDSKAFDMVSFKDAYEMDNSKTFTADKINTLQAQIWNQFLTTYGINNTNIEKKAQVNAPEVSSNLDEVFLFRRDRLNARERACEKMRALWGLDVSVCYYADMVDNPQINIAGGEKVERESTETHENGEEVEA